jgi:hypothetical protein
LGFGSDLSDIEEAPLDYSEEYCTWELFGDDADVLDTIEAVAQTSRANRNNEWETFNSQEVIICSWFTENTTNLMTGYLHTMLSRFTFLLVRLILAMKNLILPHWDSVRRTRARIWTMLNLNTRETLSVWDDKFTISLKGILANVCNLTSPIAPHMIPQVIY